MRSRRPSTCTSSRPAAAPGGPPYFYRLSTAQSVTVTEVTIRRTLQNTAGFPVHTQWFEGRSRLFVLNLEEPRDDAGRVLPGRLFRREAFPADVGERVDLDLAPAVGFSPRGPDPAP